MADIKRNAICIDSRDNVVVSIYDIAKGSTVEYLLADGSSGSLTAASDIPQFHKIARADIAKGNTVTKYGEYIGLATCDIKMGEHVHTHNCQSDDADKDNISLDTSADGKVLNVREHQTTRYFMGYKRADGNVGIRNHVLVLPTSICASDTCEQIVRSVPGCVSFHNQNGCSQVDADRDLTINTIAGLAANPNIHSVLAVSLGCEGCQNDMVIDAIRKRSKKHVEGLVIQQVGGSIKAVEAGLKIAKKLVDEASKCKREKVGIDKLMFGTNCGGSDTTSGLGSNPLIGMVSDWMVAQGATTVLCETPEFFGGEHILAKRGANKQVHDDILKIVYDYEKYVQNFGAQMREGNPSPGNIAGGLTTLEEKSLGCIHKAGHSKINKVYKYADAMGESEGLVIMDTPGNDPSSVGGIIAGGCQIVLFSTGLGTPTGNAIAPVFRITANPKTAKTMADNTDMDCSETIFGPRTMEQLRDDLIEQIIEVCNGKETCAEAINYNETALPHLCNYM